MFVNYKNMLKNEISIQKILPTISFKFKTFSGSFLRRGTEFSKNLNAIQGT